MTEMNHMTIGNEVFEIVDSQARSGLQSKADASQTYTKAEIDQALSNYVADVAALIGGDA